MPLSKGVPINGPAVKALREAKGWNGGKFAAAVGVSHPYMSRIERGQRSTVSAEVLARIAETLVVPVAALQGPYQPEQVA